jgi:hypothetical protein
LFFWQNWCPNILEGSILTSTHFFNSFRIIGTL